MTTNVVPAVSRPDHADPSTHRPQHIGMAGVGLSILAFLVLSGVGLLAVMVYVLSQLQITF